MAITKKTRSILEEISSITTHRNKEDVIDARAQHIITSAINLFETLDLSYNNVEALALKKRFLSSISGADPGRFTRMVNRIKTGDWQKNGDE